MTGTGSPAAHPADVATRFGDVAAHVEGGVGTVTLDRAASHNSLTTAVLSDLESTLRWVGRHPGCRVVVLTGSGPSFCSGMDLRHSLDEGEGADPATRATQAMRVATSTTVALRDIPQPVIAAVRGHAVGAGFAFAAASDIRVCAPDTRFNAVFTRIGMTPGDLGLSWLLPRLIGFSDAAELFYTGGVLDAPGAERLRFVSRVVDDPLAHATGLARSMAAASPLALSMTKDLLNASLGLSAFREHLQLELRSQVICSLTDAHVAALAAFRDRPRR